MARSRQHAGAAILALALGAIVLLGASPAPPAASPGPSGSAPAPGTLQGLVDAARPGAVVDVPAGVYREIRHDRQAADGARRWGRDPRLRRLVRLAGRREPLAKQRHPSPPSRAAEFCLDPRCAWPEQVFIDGQPLVQVARDPAAGQFSMEPDRRVLLGDDPRGRLVEVTMRERWLTVQAPDVTIENIAMSQAASPPQHGALQDLPGGDRLAVRGVRLSDAHGALISFQGVSGASLRSSDLSRAGQLGVHAGGDGTSDLTIEGNRIFGNNTEGFDPAWEAGGLKAAVSTGLRVIDNEVFDNDGVGIWCDIDCRDFTASGNRVHANTRAGIMFEISDGATIENNVVWENGWGFPTWGWGAGILISSSTDATVHGNLLAWNADGISVISQVRNRPGGDGVRNVSVTDNTVLSDAAAGFMLAWLQDWPGAMYTPDSGNVGSGNRFWNESAEPSGCRFEWSDCVERIAAFSATPGGGGSEYLSDEAAHAALTAAGIPVHPVPHPFGSRRGCARCCSWPAERDSSDSP